MITISNCLTFLRAPLAFLFLTESTALRILALLLAMITDSVDGYLARRSHSTSKFGAILDPVMDKFFVYFALTVIFFEGKIKMWQAASMISRDFFLCLFGLYLLIVNKWKGFQLQSVRWGKVTTAMQFLVLIGLTLNFVFPSIIFIGFIIFGALAFFELFQISINQSMV
ncbi:MAG: CDP-alcohol phosphatidyltransferase family protein [Chlamydiota bacterium]|jgi:phosphatidylglycerophosphate synthase